MRPIGIGLAVTLMLSVFVPTAVMAPALAATAPAAPAVDKDHRAKGMAAAPGLVTAAGLDCQVSDARLIGENTDPKTKAKVSFYELACTGNEGLIVQLAAADKSTQVFTCLETFGQVGADGKPSPLNCILPGNTDPKAPLLQYVAKTGVTCSVDKARALGHSATNTYFEVACAGGTGFVIMTSAPPSVAKEVTANPCVMYDATSNVRCELTDHAAQLAVADKLIAGSGKPCTVTDRKYTGISQTKELLFEVKCAEGKGYIVGQAPNGTLSRTTDCVLTDLCDLTDARAAKTEQNNLYTSLAKKAGFNCDVTRYAPFPSSAPGTEAVELVCGNHPDGAVAVFGATAADSAVYDCAHSELMRFRCSLTKPDLAYPKLTADLKALGKDSCTVSNARSVGVTADQRGFIEVACSDGLQGYMIEYAMKPLTPKTPIVCSDAKGIGNGGCKLPGNVKPS